MIKPGIFVYHFAILSGRATTIEHDLLSSMAQQLPTFRSSRYPPMLDKKLREYLDVFAY